jgi:hypothetical protein
MPHDTHATDPPPPSRYLVIVWLPHPRDPYLPARSVARREAPDHALACLYADRAAGRFLLAYRTRSHPFVIEVVAL